MIKKSSLKSYVQPTMTLHSVTPSPLMSLSMGNPDETVDAGFSGGMRNPFGDKSSFSGNPSGFSSNPFENFE